MARIRRSYRSIYTSRRKRHGKSVLKALIVVILVAALVFLGYSIADPLIKFFSGKRPVSSSSAVTSSQSSAPSSSSNPSSSQATTDTAEVHGVYLPKKYLQDTAALNNFITQAKAAGINLAVIDLKAEDGIVNYNTSLPQAKGTAMVAQNAPDAAAVAKALSDAGITPAARICAFKDPVAPTVLRGAGVMYSKNHAVNWLDPTNTRWLNPNSTDAQQYIESLATEAVSLGFKQIYIDSLTFPTSGSPDSTGYYGDNMPSKEQVISNFVAALKQQVNTAGGKLSVMTSGAAAIGQAAPNIGQSQSIYALPGDFISPNLCPSLFNKGGIQVGSTAIAKPDLAPGDTVSAVAQYLKTQNSANTGTVPFIQDFTNTSLGGGNIKQYTATDVKAEIAALNSAGMNGYILYNPEGTYDLASLK